MTTTIRLRLALVQTAVFALMATGLVLGIYFLTSQSLKSDSVDPRSEVERMLGLPAGTLLDRRTGKELPPLNPPPPTDRRTLQQVAASVQEETRTQLLRRLLILSAGLVVVTTAVTFGVGWLTARRSLRPLRLITGRARTLSERNLREPIALSGPRDELRELADTFDQMLARLDRAFAGQRFFAANASHELRTPLTRIRTKLDVTLAKPEVTRAELDELAATITSAIDESVVLIDALLTLARAQNEVAHERVDLDLLTENALADLEEAVVRRHLTVRATLNPSVVTGDPILLGRLIRNLLDNAIGHNLDGGWIEVHTHTGEDVRLQVSNGGRSISDSQLESLFLPLQRTGQERVHASSQGFGLGLSIVRAVAEAHGGWTRADSVPGGGLGVEVALPRAAADVEADAADVLHR